MKTEHIAMCSYVLYNRDQGVYLQSILYLHRANIFVSCKFVNVVGRIFVSLTVPDTCDFDYFLDPWLKKSKKANGTKRKKKEKPLKPAKKQKTQNTKPEKPSK